MPVPRVVFTPQLRRFVETPELQGRALVLRELLDEVLAPLPRLRGYVLDDQDRLRPNVVIFVDGRRSTDRATLADTLEPGSTVHVLQALSGG